MSTRASLSYNCKQRSFSCKVRPGLSKTLVRFRPTRRSRLRPQSAETEVSSCIFLYLQFLQSLFMLMAQSGGRPLRYSLEEVDLIKRLRKDSLKYTWSVMTKKYSATVSEGRFRSREAIVEKWKMINRRRSKRRRRVDIKLLQHSCLSV